MTKRAPRTRFAINLTRLWKLAGTPKVPERVVKDMQAAVGRPFSVPQRFSDWRNSVHRPATWEMFLPLLRFLIRHVTESGGKFPPESSELADEDRWEAWFKGDDRTPDLPVVVDNGLGYGLSSLDVLAHLSAAIGQLSSDSSTTQLAGVFAVERLSRESEQDRLTAVKILASYVRERAPRRREAERSDSTGVPSQRPAEPVQAALTVICNPPEGMRQPVRMNLTDTDLRGADLHLGALQSADLSNADLRDADLEGACLQVVVLSKAALSGAYFDEADLTGADISETDLSDVEGLTLGQVLEARPTRSTVLPKRMARDPSVATRVQQVEQQENLAWDDAGSADNGSS